MSAGNIEIGPMQKQSKPRRSHYLLFIFQSGWNIRVDCDVNQCGCSVRTDVKEEIRFHAICTVECVKCARYVCMWWQFSGLSDCICNVLHVQSRFRCTKKTSARHRCMQLTVTWIIVFRWHNFISVHQATNLNTFWMELDLNPSNKLLRADAHHELLSSNPQPNWIKTTATKPIPCRISSIVALINRSALFCGWRTAQHLCHG